MPEKYLLLPFKERIFTGKVVNSQSSHSPRKLDICTDLSCNSVKHFIVPLQLDLAASTTLLTFVGAKDCLSQQKHLMGATRPFFHCTCCKMEKVPLLQNWELFQLSPQANSGVSTSVMCRQPGYPGRVTHTVWALVWSQSQDKSAHIQVFCTGKDHVGCGQYNDTTCTCWHSSGLAFDCGQLAMFKETFSCSFLIISQKRNHFRFYLRKGAHRRQHNCLIQKVPS